MFLANGVLAIPPGVGGRGGVLRRGQEHPPRPRRRLIVTQGPGSRAGAMQSRRGHDARRSLALASRLGRSAVRRTRAQFIFRGLGRRGPGRRAAPLAIINFIGRGLRYLIEVQLPAPTRPQTLPARAP